LLPGWRGVWCFFYVYFFFRSIFTLASVCYEVVRVVVHHGQALDSVGRL